MNKLRVVFVEPAGAPENVFAKYMSIPLLGPIYLGTIAHNAGYDVVILNENLLRRSIRPDELTSCDILCLSCLTATVERGKKIGRMYREERTRAGKPSRVLMGGIHASMLPDDVLAECDQVVTGEAETIFLDVLSGKLSEKVVTGEKVQKLDDLPVPDFTLLAKWQSMKVLPIMTSRGCPYDCNFCSVTEMFGRQYRTQSPEKVMQELLRYRKRKRWIFFVDDHFAANIKRTEALLDLMIEHKLKYKWSAQVRTEVTKNPAFVAKMKKAGCRIVYVGFESINPSTLTNMNKNQTVDDIKRSVRVFHEHGIDIHGMFMLGNDPDTNETFKMTTDFNKECGLDYVQYSILTPLPGTQVYKQLDKENRLYHKDWTAYDGLHAVFEPKQMSAHRLQSGMIECFSEFYSYTNAFNDALNTAWHTGLSMIKSLYKQAHFPSFYPPFMKAVGRGIVRDWAKSNKAYMAYLRQLPVKVLKKSNHSS